MAKFFDMKDMANKVKIVKVPYAIQRDKEERIIYLSHLEYIEKALKHFNMDKGKAWSPPLLSYVKLSRHNCPMFKEDKVIIDKVPYES